MPLSSMAPNSTNNKRGERDFKIRLTQKEINSISV